MTNRLNLKGENVVWCICDKNTNELIETYRNKATAINDLFRLKKIYIGCELVITHIDNTESVTT